MDAKSAEAIIRSILETEEDVPRGPSEEVLVRLTELAEEGDLKGFAEFFCTYARAKRQSASFVEAKVPARIVEVYLIKREAIAPRAIVEWQRREPDWAVRVREAVWSPALFDAHVRAIAHQLRS